MTRERSTTKPDKTNSPFNQVIGTIEVVIVHKEMLDLVLGEGTIGSAVDHALQQVLTRSDHTIRTVTVHIDEERG